MQPSARPRVKICCIASQEEARLAIGAGAAALGLVSEMPSGPGVISEDLIASIVARIPPGVSSFLLTCRQNTASIVAQQRRTRANTLQLCDRVDPRTLSELRDTLPGIGLVAVVHVTGRESVDEALTLAPYADALLLDSGNQSLKVKELGGTGRRHDWRLSRQIRRAVDVPVFLAGGLTPENVAEAIREVGPYGLDVCSGLRTSGALDEDKLERFFAAIHGPSRAREE